MTTSMTARVTPTARVNQIPLPAEARAHSNLSRIDYSDAFLIATGGVELPPEQWARTMIEGSPLAMRVKLLSGWASLGLRLGAPWSRRRVLGWKVLTSTSDLTLLTANSWLGLRAELLFKTQPGGVLFATLIQQNNALAQTLWQAITPTHQAVVRSLLTKAGQRAAGDPHP